MLNATIWLYSGVLASQGVTAVKAVVFHKIGDIRLEKVKQPSIEKATDAIIRLTASAICGTDLHMIRGTLPGMKAGTILGHEGGGVVEEVGKEVKNFKVGDRVVVPSTLGCGHCSYCMAGINSQCDNANPNGPQAGTAFFGGPAFSGPFNGLQAEFARIPLADPVLVKLPEEVSDDQAILISDIFPTAYFAADIADIQKGDTVVVFGCGPVGQFAIASAKLLGAERIIAVDAIPDRLETAEGQGAEVINYNTENPVTAIHRLTKGAGAERAIDAVGVDANQPHQGLMAWLPSAEKSRHKKEVATVAPHQNPQGGNWIPGDAPSQVLDWAVQALAKAGTLSIIGVYPQTAKFFPIGIAMNKNLIIRMGNCPHLKYVPKLVDLVRDGTIDPTKVLTEEVEPMASVIEAYKAFDKRMPGWIKVELKPAAVAAK
jgi:threonine dehydrogenase-like Zn-dependent dehydrogenase